MSFRMIEERSGTKKAWEGRGKENSEWEEEKRKD